MKVKRDYIKGFADTIDVVPIGAWFGSGRKAEKSFLSPILFAVYDEEDGVLRSISRCMSFTDAMYEAIREFYFNGTPYPAGVGMTKDESKKKAVNSFGSVEALKENTDVDAVSDDEMMTTFGETLDEQEALHGDNHNDSDFVGVHCYSSRPPSSVYVTNESPPIWFKPSEVWEVSFADLTLSRTHTAASGLVEDAKQRGVALRFPRFIRRRPDKRFEQATTSNQIAQLFSKQFKQH